MYGTTGIISLKVFNPLNMYGYCYGDLGYYFKVMKCDMRIQALFESVIEATATLILFTYVEATTKGLAYREALDLFFFPMLKVLQKDQLKQAYLRILLL